MSTTDPSNASISRRAYFYPLPHPLPYSTPVPYTFGLPVTNPLNLPSTPVEPTHTLVLTSTRKQFVDIRIFKLKLPHEPELPNEGGPRERLDWAFAGSSSSVPTDDPFPRGAVENPLIARQFPEQHRAWHGQVTRAKWSHWLDTRHPLLPHLSPTHYESSLPADEGVMFPINSLQTLEFGEGVNPFTGNMWAYEEFWTDLEVEGTPKEGDLDPPKWSVVLRLEALEHGVRGLVVRVGRYCQGIVMKGEDWSVERWEWSESGEEEASGEEAEKEVEKEVGGWKRTVKIGDHFLPCAMTFQPEILKEGGTVRYYDYVWVCEERVAWRDIVGGGKTEEHRD